MSPVTEDNGPAEVTGARGMRAFLETLLRGFARSEASLLLE
jgi:hypothetical protein